MDLLVTALGNPGRKYQFTRHNIGWLVLERLSFFGKLTWISKFKGLYAQYSVDNHKIYFLMPQTFMNLSGESLVPMASFFKIPLESTIVVHDELDLPFGSIGFKKGGGAAGHNGLKSIIQCTGGQDFHRLRLGIGRPPFGDVSDWVLGQFSKDEQTQIDTYLDKAALALEEFFKVGAQKAANLYNKKSLLS